MLLRVLEFLKVGASKLLEVVGHRGICRTFSAPLTLLLCTPHRLRGPLTPDAQVSVNGISGDVQRMREALRSQAPAAAL